MASIINGFTYDIFISYRHKDNQGDHWVTAFVEALKTELGATFKESISVYFDTSAHDGLSDHHDVDLSLQEKIKSAILIPVISRTYCDPQCFAWKNEFLRFCDLASEDPFGLRVPVANGNVASRVLPVRVHELDPQDVGMLEQALGGNLRAIGFTYKAAGINRPLLPNDYRDNQFNTFTYNDQINKVANAVKEILDALATGSPKVVQTTGGRFPGSGNSIPNPVSALFGRDNALHELISLIKSNRVITILGAGGMGKTRLALELAHRLKEEFQGNVVFVSMASLTAAEDVIPALAAALGIKESEGRTLTKAISSVIADRKVLLVLDNLEQVIGVAPQIAMIISHCANLKILTTSRTPLKIRGEHEYPLQPLLLPAGKNADSVDQLMTYPSVSLFVDRAQKVNAGFELTLTNASEVVKICKRLDGLPLALELAAARIRMMSVAQLLQRLEHALDILTSGAKDLPERHQTLRGTIDWSYSLLTEPEKALFSRMAVFSGGCTMEAIEATCYEGMAALAFGEVESLVDKGLVQHIGTTGRFMMLQTIREYALERLGAAQEINKIKYRQARHYLQVANEVGIGVEANDQLGSIKRGLLEEGNLHSVLDFLLQEAMAGNAEATQMGMTLCGELYMFWHIMGKHVVSKQYALSFLALPGAADSTRGRCLALKTAAIAHWTLGDFEKGIAAANECYGIAESLGDKTSTTFCKFVMFLGNLGMGKIDDAGTHIREAVELSRQSTSQFNIGFALTATGIFHTLKGELDDAKKSFEDALIVERRNSDREGAGLSLGGLALLCSLQGDYPESIRLYQESIASFVSIGDRFEEARVQEEIAWVFLKMGNTAEARRHFLNSIHAYEDIGSVRGIGLALQGIAGVESVEHNPSTAIAIATAAEHFTEQEGIVNSYGEGFQGKVYIEDAKNKLSANELGAAIAAGKRLSLNDTMQLAAGRG